MLVLVLSLGSAFFIGLNHVLIRKSLDSATRTQVIVVSLVASTSIVWAVTVLFVDLNLLVLPAIVMFLLVGLLGPGIGRTLNIVSLNRIGVSRTIPITGTAPFFATVAAILFLGEEYSVYVFVGTLLIVLGIYILSRRKKPNGKRFDKKDLIFPLGSAAFGGLSIALTKKALVLLAEPILGAAVALAGALAITALYAAGTKRAGQFRPRKNLLKFPILAGGSMAAAFILNFSALKVGSVSVVAPILSTFPLFGVFLSHFFLREEITGRIWVAAAAIVLGIAVIQAF